MRFSALAALGCASCRRSGAATALLAALSATVGARLSVGVAWGGADAGTRMEAFCNKMAPNTATHSTIASALAVDAETRLPALPDIPTLIEAGLGAHRVADWAGVLAPAGTPTAIVDRLNREFVKAAHTPELIAKLTENGNIVASSTPQEMSRLVAHEVKNMEQLIKIIGLKAQ